MLYAIIAVSVQTSNAWRLPHGLRCWINATCRAVLQHPAPLTGFSGMERTQGSAYLVVANRGVCQLLTC